MPITMHCPNPACSRASRLPDNARGRWARCPACGHKFQVPAETAEASAATRGPTLPETLPTTPPSRKPAASTQQTLPAHIGRFVIKERLGAGAFGAVYRAHDPQLGREVALKVPHPGSLSEPCLVERFLREGRAAAGLHHPHIVPVFDAGQDGPHHYLAAAFVPGLTLAHEASSGPLDGRRAAELVRQLAEALAYAHGQGVVHRDIKPANVLLDEKGEAHLADFGLAHRADEGGDLTREDAVLGTPAYMAPEQAAGQKGEPLPASDQYSLGAVLYELLTGEAPFSGPPAIVLYNVIHQEPEPPHKRNPHIPPELEAVCLKALAKRPEARYTGCADLAADLRRWLEGEPVSVRPLGVAGRALRWLKREPKLAALAALTVVGLLTASALAITKARELKAKEEATAGLKREAEKQKQQTSDLAQQAEDERQKAVDQVRAAERDRTKAADRKNEARAQQDFQNKATADTRKAEAEATKQEREARQLLYKAHLDLAASALDRKDAERALYSLTQHRHDDLRDPRWHTLWKRLPDELTWLDHKAQLTCLALRADGRALASGSRDQTVRLREWVALKGQQPFTFRGHTYWVNSVCFSPDGKRIASAGVDIDLKTRAGRGEVKVWDAATGKEALTFRHTHSFTCVCFSPDGKRLATMSTDQMVNVWDAATGLKQLSIAAHNHQVTSVCFSPDGKRLATASWDGTVKVWHATTGRKLLALRSHLSGAHGVCFSPDGKRLATAGNDVRPVPVQGGPASWRSSGGDRFAAAGPDGTVKVWDAVSGRPLLTLKGGYQFFASVCFSSDGKRIAASEFWGGALWVWDAATGEKQLVINVQAPRVLSVCFSPDGKYLASGGTDKLVKVWDAHRGQAIRTLQGHTDEVTSVCFSPDGKHLVSASKDHMVKVWDGSAGERHAMFSDHTAPVTVLAFSGSGQLASAAEDRIVRLWDPATGKGNDLPGKAGPLTALVFTPNNKLLAGTGSDGTITIWQTEPREKWRTIQDKAGVSRALCFSPDGTILAVARGTAVRVWDADSGKERLALAGPTGTVTCLTFQPNGKVLAGGSEDGSVRLWDVATGKGLATLAGHPGAVQSLSFSPDGHTLASGSTDKQVRLWNVPGGSLLRSLEGQAPDVRAVAFGRDGRALVAAGSDGTLSGWSLVAGVERFARPGPAGTHACAAISPDGRLLATGGKGKVIKLWDAATGKELGTLEMETGEVWELSFSPDGKTLASAGLYSGIALWDMPAGRRRRMITTNTVRLAFSPDGKTLATGGDGPSNVYLWEVATGKNVASFAAHRGFVAGLSFRPDGKELVSMDSGGELKLWDVATGKARATLKGNAKSGSNLVFRPDGKTIVCADDAGNLWQWDAAAAKLKDSSAGPGKEDWLVAFSRDGATVALGSRSGRVQLWSYTGRLKRTLAGHTARVIGLSFAPDGKDLVSIDEKGTIKLWDLRILPESPK